MSLVGDVERRIGTGRYGDTHSAARRTCCQASRIGSQPVIVTLPPMSSRSDRIAIELSEWAAMGDWRLYFLYRDRLEKVTAEVVERVAQEFLTRSNRTVGM